MPRARTVAVGLLVVAGLVGTFLNERGPFADTPVITYEQVFTDYAAQKVEQFSQWRDQIQIRETDGRVFRAVVPAGHTFFDDFARARETYIYGYAYESVPDDWLAMSTPWAPMLLLIAAVLIWSSSLIRGRRFGGTPETRLAA